LCFRKDFTIDDTDMDIVVILVSFRKDFYNKGWMKYQVYKGDLTI
jgi:hypothetical protein